MNKYTHNSFFYVMLLIGIISSTQLSSMIKTTTAVTSTHDNTQPVEKVQSLIAFISNKDSFPQEINKKIALLWMMLEYCDPLAKTDAETSQTANQRFFKELLYRTIRSTPITIKKWKIPTKHVSPFEIITLSPNKKIYIVQNQDSVDLYDVKTQKHITTIATELHLTPFIHRNLILFHPRGNRNGDTQSIRLYDLKKNIIHTLYKNAPPTMIPQISSNEKYIAVADQDNIILYNIKKVDHISSSCHPHHNVKTVTFSTDNTLLASTAPSGDSTLKLWSLKNGTLTPLAHHSPQINPSFILFVNNDTNIIMSNSQHFFNLTINKPHYDLTVNKHVYTTLKYLRTQPEKKVSTNIFMECPSSNAFKASKSSTNLRLCSNNGTKLYSQGTTMTSAPILSNDEKQCAVLSAESINLLTLFCNDDGNCTLSSTKKIVGSWDRIEFNKNSSLLLAHSLDLCEIGATCGCIYGTDGTLIKEIPALNSYNYLSFHPNGRSVIHGNKLHELYSVKTASAIKTAIKELDVKKYLEFKFNALKK